MVDPKIRLMNADRRPRAAVRHSLAVLLVLLATIAPGAVSAHAADGTWLGARTEWIDPLNWASNPDTPGGTATFTNNGASATVDVNGTVLYQRAPIAGSATITNNLNGILTFSDTATAGSATTGNDGTVTFLGSSSGGTSSAHLNNNSGGSWDFNNTSTAGAAIHRQRWRPCIQRHGQSRNVQHHQRFASQLQQWRQRRSRPILNINNSQIGFNDTSTADHATITNLLAFVVFNDQSTAANATINGTLGATYFTGNSFAGSSHITNMDTVGLNAPTIFSGSATAASATIVNDLGGSTMCNPMEAGYHNDMTPCALNTSGGSDARFA
jgi:hypothetical protein